MAQHVVTLVVVMLAGLPALGLVGAVDRAVVAAASGTSGPSWLVGGAAAGAMAVLALRRHRRLRFALTLQHELAHAAAAVALGAAPCALQASPGAGRMQYQIDGPLRSTRMFLITVAPYWYSPLLVLPALILLAGPPGTAAPAAATGVVLGAALAAPLTQLGWGQPDLRRYLWVPAVAAAVWLWAATAAVALTLALDGLPAAVAAWADGWSVLLEVLS